MAFIMNSPNNGHIPPLSPRKLPLVQQIIDHLLNNFILATNPRFGFIMRFKDIPNPKEVVWATPPSKSFESLVHLLMGFERCKRSMLMQLRTIQYQRGKTGSQSSCERTPRARFLLSSRAQLSVNEYLVPRQKVVHFSITDPFPFVSGGSSSTYRKYFVGSAGFWISLVLVCVASLPGGSFAAP
jgi:hypothetical protein